MNTLTTPSSLMQITPRPEPVVVRGAGSYLWDEAGRRYLDFIQGWAVNCLGHCPPEIAAALAEQAQTLITPSPALHNRPQLRLAELLRALSGMAEVHFTNSGAEANEAAMKLARKWGRLNRGGAFGIVSTVNAFHGRTLAMMAASGKPGWHELFPPYPEGFKQVPFGDIDAMRNAIDATTVAIMIEPIQGEAGVVVPPPGYLAGLRALADEHELLLIFDEIQTGIGRTGKMFEFQHHDVVPDIMTLGKGIGGGVPLAAVIANDRAACFEYGDQGGTYNGNPLMTAVGIAVVNTVADERFLHEVRKREAVLRAGLIALSERHGLAEVRGRGLLYAIVLAHPRAEAVRDAAFELGLVVNAARPDVIRLMPSLRVSETEIAACLERLDQAFETSYAAG